MQHILCIEILLNILHLYVIISIKHWNTIQVVLCHFIARTVFPLVSNSTHIISVQAHITSSLNIHISTNNSLRQSQHFFYQAPQNSSSLYSLSNFKAAPIFQVLVTITFNFCTKIGMTIMEKKVMNFISVLYLLFEECLLRMKYAYWWHRLIQVQPQVS